MMRGFMPQGVYNKAAMTDEVIELYLAAPWSTEAGKKALFRNFRRLNPDYTQAIARDLKHLTHETLVMWAENNVFQ
jgi:2-hydroxymuconate-semialdehyde hydrolase